MRLILNRNMTYRQMSQAILNWRKAEEPKSNPIPGLGFKLPKPYGF